MKIERLDKFTVRVTGASYSGAAERAAAQEFGITEEKVRLCCPRATYWKDGVQVFEFTL